MRAFDCVMIEPCNAGLAGPCAHNVVPNSPPQHREGTSLTNRDAQPPIQPEAGMSSRASPFDLGGRVAVVTGGNGGIGRSIALARSTLRHP